jgi:hypothetical protein
MNIIAKGPTMTTSLEAVAKIASVFADIEKSQRGNIRAVRQLRDEYQAIHNNGDAGALVTMAAFAQLDALVTSQYAETLALHEKQTVAALERGIDTGPMQPSEDDGMVSPMSGGGR